MFYQVVIALLVLAVGILKWKNMGLHRERNRVGANNLWAASYVESLINDRNDAERSYVRAEKENGCLRGDLERTEEDLKNALQTCDELTSMVVRLGGKEVFLASGVFPEIESSSTPAESGEVQHIVVDGGAIH